MTTKKTTKKTNGKPAGAAKNSPKRPTKPASARAAKKATKATPKSSDATVANTGDTAAPARRVKEVKLSAMQAAIKVLADAPPEGMSAKEMVEAMGERRLWTSPGGKTPEASLYASIIREIGRKGEGARFRKVSRGRFVLR